MGSDGSNDDATPSVVRLQLLDTARWQLGGQPARSLARKDAALLAVLAIDGPTLRSRAATLLWPDAGVDGARNSLRQRVFRLRRLAGREIVEQGETLTLAAHVEHDLADAEAALQRDAAARPGELLGALDFHDSPELAAWVEKARQEWRALRRDILAKCAARHESDDRVTAALAYAQRLVRDAPLLEHAQRQLMRLHYRSGDRGAALAAYEQLKNALDAELGEAPARETQALVGQIEAAVTVPVAPPPRPLTLPRPPRLVGRESDRAVLEAAWAEGRGVLVRGEPGIGKSRLLAEFAPSGFELIRVQGRPGDVCAPYAVLARLVRDQLHRRARRDELEPRARAELARIVPELGASPPGPLDPLRLQCAVQTWLAAGPALGIVIDDAQFVDPASLDIFLRLVGAAPRLAWLMTVRAAEISPALRQGLAALDPQRWVGVDLRPLTAGEVEALLASLNIPDLSADRWAARIHRHTGGNPLFILETLQVVLRDSEAGRQAGPQRLPLPASLGALIAHRLERLSPLALKLARVAAVAGADFHVEMAADVLQVHPHDLSDAWRELEHAQLMHGRAFAHDLGLEAVLASLPAPISRWLHAAVAAAAARGAPNQSVTLG